VYSEVIPHTATVEQIKARDPQAVVLSGGPASVYADGAPRLDPALFDLGVPVFGICYGFQAMAQALGGTVAHTGASEYGRTELKVVGGELHSGLPDTQPVWMSHGDAVTAAPAGFEVAGPARGAPVPRSRTGPAAGGVQYHPRSCTHRTGSRCSAGSCTSSPASAPAGHRPTSPIRWSRRCANRSATAAPSAGCPAAWTPRWPPRWCTSATG
jgi:GMP synthase (glutamine-hydrolysing) A subunit